MAGYSKTPLAQKLGVKPGTRLALEHAPPSFLGDLGPLADGVEFVRDGNESADLVVYFVKSQKELRDRFPAQAARIFPAGILWISWPKKSSGVASDLDENRIRDIGLRAGLVDVKVCAVDETWSGLKFVVRLKDRPAAPKASSPRVKRPKHSA
jgi:hypothetical protein